MVSEAISGNDPGFDNKSNQYAQLVDAIAADAVLFVGAGSSCRIGYPSWGQLLDCLHEAVERNGRRTDDLRRWKNANGLVRADEYRSRLGPTQYYDIIKSAFAPTTPPHDSFHETLVRLPFRYVLTTNYDHVLESAHTQVYNKAPFSFNMDDWDTLADFWQVQANSARKRCYIHVHGEIDRPESIVLSQGDYDARYIHETRARGFLHDVLTGQRVVFVGFSLEDEDLSYILREVAGKLGVTQSRHFVLLPYPDTAQQENRIRMDFPRKYHVEPIFFDNPDRDYSSLVRLVDTLEKDVQGRRREDGKKQYVDIDSISLAAAELFPDQPEIQNELQHRLPELLHRHAVSIVVSDTTEGHTSIDDSITNVFQFVKQGLVDKAVEEYGKISQAHGPELTDKQKYRLAANMGHAFYAKGDTDTAAAKYLEAVGYFRESQDAQGLEVLAHLLLGHQSEGVRLADSLCNREPTFARARSLWIQLQPDDVTFSEVEDQVSDDLRNDAEVALALSYLAQRKGNMTVAERYARIATSATENWPEAMSALATIILISEKGSAKFDIDQGYVPRSPDRVSEAASLLTAAIEQIPTTDPRGVLAGLYFNRSTAHRLGGNSAAAASDLRKAFERNPQDASIIKTLAVRADGATDIEQALSAIDAFPPDSTEHDELCFAKLHLLLRRGHSSDLEQAFDGVGSMMARIGDVEPSWLRTDIARLGLQLSETLHRESHYRDLLSRIPAQTIPANEMARFKAYVERIAGNLTQARKHAKEAVETLSSNANWLDRREVALVAQDCGLYVEALGLWESVLGDDCTNSDTLYYVRCTFLAGEWKKVLDTCARLRAAGKLQRKHLLAEVEVLTNSREANRAITFLQYWLRDHQDDKQIRLRLSAVALLQRRCELVEFGEHVLPSAEEISCAEEGEMLVYVLRRGPTPNRALEVAYELYRKFPERLSAHRALVACVFDPTVEELEIARPTSVGKDTAACIRRAGDNNAFRWVYVESGVDPATARDEYPESHQLITALWGKRAGDRLTYQEHEYEIVAVENKILRRVHELIGRVEEDFPDAPFIRRFSIPRDASPDASPEEAMGEAFTVLKSQAQRREHLESMCTGNRLPIAGFAKLMGRPVFETTRYLASRQGLTVHASTGHPQEWATVRKWLVGRGEVVLDATALATAQMLGLLATLPKLGYRLIVPNAVLDEVQEISLEAANPRGVRRLIGFHEGRLFLHESSLEDLAKEVEALERVQRFVREQCEVVGGEATLELPTTLRLQLEGLLGEAATDAMALAKKRSALLWTDDLGIRIMARSSDFKVQSVWTQNLLMNACETGKIDHAEYTAFVGNLIIRGYAFTSLTALDMASLFRRGGWRARSPLGTAVVRLIAAVALKTAGNCLITAAAFLLIWRQCPRRGLARDIIVSILEGIGREHATPLLTAVCRNPSSEFRPKELRPLKRMLRSWHAREREFRPGRGARGCVLQSISTSR